LVERRRSKGQRKKGKGRLTVLEEKGGENERGLKQGPAEHNHILPSLKNAAPTVKKTPGNHPETRHDCRKKSGSIIRNLKLRNWKRGCVEPQESDQGGKRRDDDHTFRWITINERRRLGEHKGAGVNRKKEDRNSILGRK